MLRGVVSETSEPQPNPAEPREQLLGRQLFGYKREPVDELLRDTAAATESIKAEKVELAKRIVRLEADLARRRESERLLRSTLITTERAADTVLERARTETEQVLAEAGIEARRLVVAARAEKERLDSQSSHRAALLRTAQTILETEPGAASTPGGAETLDEALREQVQRNLNRE